MEDAPLQLKGWLLVADAAAAGWPQGAAELLATAAGENWDAAVLPAGENNGRAGPADSGGLEAAEGAAGACKERGAMSCSVCALLAGQPSCLVRSVPSWADYCAACGTASQQCSA